MEFTHLLAIVGDEPVFATDLLLAGAVDADDVRRQLSRWVSAGRLYQLRRGLYALAPPFQRVRPPPFLVANRLVRGSYVSQQAALAHYGLIPEAAPVVTSVTTGRPGRWETPLGVYEYRHVKTGLFFGYRRTEISPGQRAFVAAPEKALLDLVYLHAGGDEPTTWLSCACRTWSVSIWTCCANWPSGPPAPNCAARPPSWPSWRTLRLRSTRNYESDPERGSYSSSKRRRVNERMGGRKHVNCRSSTLRRFGQAPARRLRAAVGPVERHQHRI
ncbi:MAG: hypothetical protein WBF31_23635 [Anaerolineae bacterium]